MSYPQLSAQSRLAPNQQYLINCYGINGKMIKQLSISIPADQSPIAYITFDQVNPQAVFPAPHHMLASAFHPHSMMMQPIPHYAPQVQMPHHSMMPQHPTPIGIIQEPIIDARRKIIEFQPSCDPSIVSAELSSSDSSATLIADKKLLGVTKTVTPEHLVAFEDAISSPDSHPNDEEDDIVDISNNPVVKSPPLHSTKEEIDQTPASSYVEAAKKNVPAPPQTASPKNKKTKKHTKKSPNDRKNSPPDIDQNITDSFDVYNPSSENYPQKGGNNLFNFNLPLTMLPKLDRDCDWITYYPQFLKFLIIQDAVPEEKMDQMRLFWIGTNLDREMSAPSLDWYTCIASFSKNFDFQTSPPSSKKEKITITDRCAYWNRFNERKEKRCVKSRCHFVHQCTFCGSEDHGAFWRSHKDENGLLIYDCPEHLLLKQTIKQFQEDDFTIDEFIGAYNTFNDFAAIDTNHEKIQSIILQHIQSTSNVTEHYGPKSSSSTQKNPLINSDLTNLNTPSVEEFPPLMKNQSTRPKKSLSPIASSSSSSSPDPEEKN